jgi:hypothetical protein
VSVVYVVDQGNNGERHTVHQLFDVRTNLHAAMVEILQLLVVLLSCIHLDLEGQKLGETRDAECA